MPNSTRDHELSESAANLLVKDFDTPHALASELLKWLRDEPRTAESLLDFVLAFDQGLERIADSNTIDVIDSVTKIDDSQTIQMWRARRGLLATFDREATIEARVRTNASFTPSLDARLTTIRFVNVLNEMPPAIVETLHSDVAARFHDLFEDGILVKPLRVGMFSLRGDFAPPIEYTGAVQDWHGFQLGEIDAGNAIAYEDAIRSIVRAASDPDRGAHILVLPEFMVTPAGRAILKHALIEASKTAPLVPPILTIGGTCHMPIPGTTDIGNSCDVFSSRGEVLWTQWKRVRFATEWRAKAAQDKIHGFPMDIDPGTDVKLKENIELHGPTKIVRAPFGCIAVAICSDLITHDEGAPGVYLADLPVDCLAVPAFSFRTKPFVDRAYELGRSLKVVFFVNAWPAVELGTNRRMASVSTTPKHPPAQASADVNERVLASFVSTPWTGYPIEFWQDQNDEYALTTNSAFWLGVAETADGLIVDLRDLILGSLDAHLTH
jgi:predicted amidohydrolase